MEHKLRRITYITEDCAYSLHPSMDGDVKVFPIPGGERTENSVYGCKVCGLSLPEIIEGNLPCAGTDLGELVDEALSGFYEDGGSLG